MSTNSAPGHAVRRGAALAQLPRAGHLVFRLVGGRFGGFRDGEAVDGWATGTAGGNSLGSVIRVRSPGKGDRVYTALR
ncbi:hypothetical protein [Streptomyces incanus]|uniref:Uncharacterized protein n=1 Tax=Streptomyces incanus TaxID=887453 RepID=A0ABW0XWF0_9ACTN